MEEHPSQPDDTGLYDVSDGYFLEATPTPHTTYIDNLFMNIDPVKKMRDASMMDTIEPIFRLISNTTSVAPANAPVLQEGASQDQDSRVRV